MVGTVAAVIQSLHLLGELGLKFRFNSVQVSYNSIYQRLMKEDNLKVPKIDNVQK